MALDEYIKETRRDMKKLNVEYLKRGKYNWTFGDEMEVWTEL